jgi:ABC-type amino acid transport/signal transduction systems, periplasmic component/domain
MKKILLGLCLFVLLGCSNNSNAENNQLVVGMECNYAPFNWTQLNDDNGAIKISNTEGYCAGYDVEIAKLIADELGLELVIKKVTDFDALPSEANTNQIDLIIAGMSATQERLKVLAFSEPYYFSDLVLVVRKDGDYTEATSIQDFNGARVSAQIGTMHVGFISQINGVNQSTSLSDFPTLTIALKSGDIDAFVSERPVAQAITANNSDLTFVDFEEELGFSLTNEDETELAVSIGMRRNENELLEKVNAILNGLSHEERDGLMRDAIINQPEAGE